MKVISTTGDADSVEVQIIAPPDGYVANPLRNFPRNSPCFCGSGAKFKKCCFTRVKRYCDADAADAIKKSWTNLLIGRQRIDLK